MTHQRTVEGTEDLASYAEDLLERISTNTEIRSSLEPEYPNFFKFVREAKVLIAYSPRFREFSIWVSSGGSQRLEFCPWSGKRFPNSLRDDWFDEMDRRNIDPGNRKQEIPAEFQSEKWWVDRGL